MIARKARSWWLAAVCGLGLVCCSSGCQTYFVEAGLTLPTGRYLDHPPTFIPPTPPFPLPREQASLEQAVAQPTALPRNLLPGGGAPLPPPQPLAPMPPP
jgi:hypothetical protein